MRAPLVFAIVARSLPPTRFGLTPAASLTLAGSEASRDLLDLYGSESRDARHGNQHFFLRLLPRQLVKRRIPQPHDYFDVTRFMAGLVSTAAISCAKAEQSGKVHRIAIAYPSYPVSEMNEASGPWFAAFFAELRRLGYIEGQNLRVERYSAEGRTAQYADLAREVVSRSPDVILTGAAQCCI